MQLPNQRQAGPWRRLKQAVLPRHLARIDDLLRSVMETAQENARRGAVMVGCKAPGVRQQRNTEQVDLVSHYQGRTPCPGRPHMPVD